MLSKNIKKVDISEVRKMFDLTLKIKNPINLTIGQPDFPIPKRIKNSAIKAINENKNSYVATAGIPQLREAIAKKLSLKNKISTTSDNVLITNAVSGGLSIVLDVLLNPKDEVIIFDPYFVGYLQQIHIKGGTPVIVKCNSDFTINFKNLESKISNKTKAIIINTPNNPTGKVYSKKELTLFSNIAKKYNLFIISDEIYESFIYEGSHFSISSIYNKTITINGFSKSHSMTGWRVGYLHAPKEIIQACIKSQQFIFVCAPTPFQYASLTALKTNMDKYISQYKIKRDIVFNGLKDNFDLIKPNGAFYFFIKSPYHLDDFISDCLLKNLLVASGSAFSKDKTHFRLSFSSSIPNIKKGIKILNSLVKKN